MRMIIFGFLLMFFAPLLMAQETLYLGNDPWPPFVIPGEEQGTSELIVCEALKRAGWACSIRVGDWQETLRQASDGELDGIAAIWHTAEREATLRFSSAYLTNRLLPVVSIDSGLQIRGLNDLAGLRVATQVGAAYGAKIEAAMATFTVVDVQSMESAMRAVQTGDADVAPVDELIARDYADSPEGEGLVIGQLALSYRELYFAVSRKHPRNMEIIAAFNEAYQSMLQDGTVNRILDIDWLVTDLKQDGVLDFVYRSDISPDSGADPGSSDIVYTIGQDEYQQIRQPDFNDSAVNYRVDSVVHETVEAAMNAVFKKEKSCSYDHLSARIVCTSK